MGRSRSSGGLAVAVVAATLGATQHTAQAVDAIVPSYRIVGDAIPEPLTSTPGDARRGRAIVANRQVGLCLLCHSGPIPEERFQGNLAPDLAGAGARWSVGQLRLRVVDARRANPQTIMPPYLRTEGLVRIGTSWRGKTVLDPQQVEDVIAFLATLRG